MGEMAGDVGLALHRTPEGVMVDVWAVPGASGTAVAGVHDGALKVRAAAPARGGRANRVIADLLADLTEADVELLGGATTRRKQFLLRGVTIRAVRVALSEAMR